jgi:hypothetical protein
LSLRAQVSKPSSSYAPSSASEPRRRGLSALAEAIDLVHDASHQLVGGSADLCVIGG